jgi:hypothetical protein
LPKTQLITLVQILIEACSSNNAEKAHKLINTLITSSNDFQSSEVPKTSLST